MPGERSLKLQEYYAHRRNQFWKIMFELLKVPFSEDYEKKKELLLSKGIALWDVLKYCERTGSADNKIKNETVNDFESFFAKHPLIKHAFFTSGKAQSVFEDAVKCATDLKYFKLPSPSSANTWKRFDDKLNDWKLILIYL